MVGNLVLEPLRGDVAAEIVVHLAIVHVVLRKVVVLNIRRLVADDVCQEEVQGRRNQYIFWLQISMHEASRVNLAYTAEQLENEPLLLDGGYLWDLDAKARDQVLVNELPHEEQNGRIEPDLLVLNVFVKLLQPQREDVRVPLQVEAAVHFLDEINDLAVIDQVSLD